MHGRDSVREQFDGNIAEEVDSHTWSPMVKLAHGSVEVSVEGQ